jgi:hypothetical protein
MNPQRTERQPKMRTRAVPTLLLLTIWDGPFINDNALSASDGQQDLGGRASLANADPSLLVHRACSLSEIRIAMRTPTSVFSHLHYVHSQSPAELTAVPRCLNA